MKRNAVVLLVLIVAVLVLAGCPAPTPQVIEVPKEVVVEKEVVQTVEVVKEVLVEREVAAKVLTLESRIFSPPREDWLDGTDTYFHADQDG